MKASDTTSAGLALWGSCFAVRRRRRCQISGSAVHIMCTFVYEMSLTTSFILSRHDYLTKISIV